MMSYDPKAVIKIRYTNYRGETAVRRIVPSRSDSPPPNGIPASSGSWTPTTSTARRSAPSPWPTSRSGTSPTQAERFLGPADRTAFSGTVLALPDATGNS